MSTSFVDEDCRRPGRQLLSGLIAGWALYFSLVNEKESKWFVNDQFKPPDACLLLLPSTIVPIIHSKSEAERQGSCRNLLSAGGNRGFLWLLLGLIHFDDVDATKSYNLSTANGLPSPRREPKFN